MRGPSTQIVSFWILPAGGHTPQRDIFIRILKTINRFYSASQFLSSPFVCLFVCLFVHLSDKMIDDPGVGAIKLFFPVAFEE